MEKLDNSKLTDEELFEWGDLCYRLAYEIEELHREPLKSDLARYNELKQKQIVEE